MFKIDFIELCILAEACIPPRPIARACFWHKLIDVIYYELNKGERLRLYKWICKNDLDYDDKDVQVFINRFNPYNQYLVTTKDKVYECFLMDDRYYINKNTPIVESDIIGIEKI